MDLWRVTSGPYLVSESSLDGIAAATVLFALSLAYHHALRQEFLPPQDQSRFLITIYTNGFFIKVHGWRVSRSRKTLQTRPEIDTYYVAVGGFGGGLVNQGISFVTMKD